MILGKRVFRPLTSRDICRIYELLHERSLVSFPITNQSINKIDALVSSIINKHYEKEFYPSIEQKVVAYLYFIIKDHPFTDGNKRAAVLSFEVLCDINNLKLKYSDIQLDALAVFVEKITDNDHQKIIQLLSDFLF